MLTRAAMDEDGCVLFYLMTAIPTASWRKIVDEMRRGDAGLVRAWLYDLDAPELAGGIMTIRTRNDAQRSHLEQCSGPLARSVQSTLGRLVSVRFEVSDNPPPGKTIGAPPPSANLRADFTLDQFVIAPENQMAHAAALRLIEGETNFNPLFLHGPRGAGKSHLLQGLCRIVAHRPVDNSASAAGSTGRQGYPDGLYRTACKFVADYTSCFDAGSAPEFRRGFLRAGVVAIDEVEGFSGKSRSQEELFHIVNSLVAAGTPLILAADRPPSAMDGLAERLVSRFTAGLVIAMDAPGEETRLRILERKNDAGRFGHSGDVLAELARRCRADDLDGVLVRLDALGASRGGSVTMDLVEDVLRDAGGVCLA